VAASPRGTRFPVSSPQSIGSEPPSNPDRFVRLVNRLSLSGALATALHKDAPEVRVTNRQPAGIDQLCYLPASSVEVPDGSLAEYDLCGTDDRKLGTLDGVLIDATERRVRYFVVESKGLLGKKRYLLSADETTHLEPEDNTLRVDVEAGDPWRHAFDADAVRSFSDDDLLDALFSARVN